MIFEVPTAVSVDQKLFEAGSTWLIYGAGGMGRKAAAFLVGRGVQVTHFLDINARPGQSLDGIPVLHPESAEAKAQRASAILVAVFNYTAAQDPIFQLLGALEPRIVVPYFDFHEAFHQELPDNYWLTRRSFYADFPGELREMAGALEDDLSRETLEATLKLRMRGEWRALESLRLEPQYFPEDIGLPTRLHLVDCGACIGETEQNALLSGRTLEAVYAFEPDAANFRQLSQNLGQMPAEGSVALWPCGVYSETAHLQFAAGTGASSHLDADGAAVVPVVALDDALTRTPVNFLKMDVEGAEPEVLRGARKLLQRERPALAVCVYHEPAHLWAILLQLKEMVSGYRYFLRSHQYNGFDLVLYAIPRPE